MSFTNLENKHTEGELSKINNIPRKERHVIQVSISNGEIIALCNDGTVWSHLQGVWQYIPQIPQWGIL